MNSGDNNLPGNDQIPTGEVQTEGGDFIRRDKVIHGDEVRRDKVTNIFTGVDKQYLLPLLITMITVQLVLFCCLRPNDIFTILCYLVCYPVVFGIPSLYCLLSGLIHKDIKIIVLSIVSGLLFIPPLLIAILIGSGAIIFGAIEELLSTPFPSP